MFLPKTFKGLEIVMFYPLDLYDSILAWKASTTCMCYLAHHKRSLLTFGLEETDGGWEEEDHFMAGFRLVRWSDFLIRPTVRQDVLQFIALMEVKRVSGTRILGKLFLFVLNVNWLWMSMKIWIKENTKFKMVVNCKWDWSEGHRKYFSSVNVLVL